MVGKGNAWAASSWLHLQEGFGDPSSGLELGARVAAGLNLSKAPFTPLKRAEL